MDSSRNAEGRRTETECRAALPPVRHSDEADPSGPNAAALPALRSRVCIPEGWAKLGGRVMALVSVVLPLSSLLSLPPELTLVKPPSTPL